MTDLSPSDLAKDAAARAGVALVQDGMRLGLGTGSTAVFMVHRLAGRIRAEGLRLRCAATSRATCDLATHLGIHIEELDEIGWLDLTLDGADEIDPDLNLIKGGGGAHLREKITAAASDRMVVIADPTKVVETLGAFHLPVEVIPFGVETTVTHIRRLLESLDLTQRPILLRQRDGHTFRTDEGNLIIDLSLEVIEDCSGLSSGLAAIPGVVEHGLFLGMCDLALVGAPDGSVIEMTRPEVGP
ncbi:MULTISPECIES: ribose-5-phosphate isomerase RpiA [unclassified Paracoccus (in: a-proteobacteria)]|uniref:ribose-5-phosphate isomerase RpiA n=1 Tax=unclassified Paracoccus (in: a-proteobacteria) TaxID=2688777 RepID=UPI001603FE1A|nr:MULTISPECIES: ribose-5-phosphate isomerase RpiA [unclassified Paracoccus (in: a-proteobacteria)]MBB1492225.1 ribose-5-phosphate isomerase RpiA [Paracoccus sp. MC1854]MBB1498693.1 ribose-5-phosphate isomerase RpiA [Paracoccus sp. MC1862]QQO45621.1 ribose-5-phosphate isomerase RpiA [Paracoccus sp. MC1862]